MDSGCSLDFELNKGYYKEDGVIFSSDVVRSKAQALPLWYIKGVFLVSFKEAVNKLNNKLDNGQRNKRILDLSKQFVKLRKTVIDYRREHGSSTNLRNLLVLINNGFYKTALDVVKSESYPDGISSSLAYIDEISSLHNNYII